MESKALGPAEEIMTPLLGLGRDELQLLAGGLGLRPYQTDEIYRWVYSRRNLDPLSWTNLPKQARESLARTTCEGLPEVAGERASADGTRKFLLRLQDGEAVEAVFIPEGERRTVCVSSQAGCALKCSFCLTGAMGIRRNLGAGEILGQLFALERETDLAAMPYNIVFMGMGEPMANLGNLSSALGILLDPQGMAVSRRRATVSTVGLFPALDEFAALPFSPLIAISLHAARDDLRDRLVPANRRFPLGLIRKFLQGQSRRGRERISLEYVLLMDVNDSEDDARDLARFSKGLKVKVNLLHFNPASGLPFQRSTAQRARAFQELLLDRGIATSIRKSRGLDILAACGQLAKAGWENTAPPEVP